MWIWFVLIQQPMNKKEMLPLLLINVRVIEVMFPIQKKEEKKTKSNHWLILKLASYRVGIVETFFPGSRVSSPNRFWSSSLGEPFLFIFFSDTWLGPPEFFLVHCPLYHVWRRSWVLDPPWGLPAFIAHCLPETDLMLTAYSKLF